MGGAIISITTRRQDVTVSNYGHAHCRFCSYKLLHNLDGDGPDPHMVDVWANNPNRMTTDDCHCSTVYDFVPDGCSLHRYTVSVVRQLDCHRGLMRERVRDGASHNELE